MLRIHEDALQLVREVAPLAAAIARSDADLARQLRRALSSVPLNVAEGGSQRGARRASHYSIALGSAREALSALRTAEAWGYLPGVPAHVVDESDKVFATLYVVSHGTRRANRATTLHVARSPPVRGVAVIASMAGPGSCWCSDRFIGIWALVVLAEPVVEAHHRELDRSRGVRPLTALAVARSTCVVGRRRCEEMVTLVAHERIAHLPFGGTEHSVREWGRIGFECLGGRL